MDEKTIKQVADELGFSTQYTTNLVKKHGLKITYLHKRLILIPKSEVTKLKRLLK